MSQKSSSLLKKVKNTISKLSSKKKYDNTEFRHLNTSWADDSVSESENNNNNNNTLNLKKLKKHYKSKLSPQKENNLVGQLSTKPPITHDLELLRLKIMHNSALNENTENSLVRLMNSQHKKSLKNKRHPRFKLKKERSSKKGEIINNCHKEKDSKKLESCFISRANYIHNLIIDSMNNYNKLSNLQNTDPKWFIKKEIKRLTDNNNFIKENIEILTFALEHFKIYGFDYSFLEKVKQLLILINEHNKGGNSQEFISLINDFEVLYLEEQKIKKKLSQQKSKKSNKSKKLVKS